MRMGLHDDAAGEECLMYVMTEEEFELAVGSADSAFFLPVSPGRALLQGKIPRQVAFDATADKAYT